MAVKSVHIKNFKSIVDLSLDLGEVNVFIGENGSGKSNILEAIAFGSAAAVAKLDHEFLASRGIRVTDTRFMRSAFVDVAKEPVVVHFTDHNDRGVIFEISAGSAAPYPKWKSTRRLPGFASALSTSTDVDSADVLLRELLDSIDTLTPAGDDRRSLDPAAMKKLLREMLERNRPQDISLIDFIIYSPENSALRTFEQEGQIVPLGIHGEGLLKLLRVLANEDREAWSALEENLRLLDWFSSIEVDQETSLPEQSIRLRDRFISESLPSFDQRSANEGFLYLLFFLALLFSERTPHFFAIENVDTSLNTKACSELMRRLATLAIERKKQILFTTHNPSLLDGLNLHDDKQRLFVVSRNRDGHTIARRIHAPKPVGTELPIRLSEAFTRGLLGGIPQNF